MIRKLVLFLAITAVLLTGCTMIPKYTRPEAPVPAGLAKWSGLQRDPGHPGGSGARRPAMAGILRW